MRFLAPCVLVLVACGGPTGSGGTGGGDPGTGGGGTVDTSNHTVDSSTLSCDMVAAVGRQCASCHGNPATQGAHLPLLTRDDFLAPMPDDMAITVGEISAIRVASMGTDIMPPPDSTPATASDIESIVAWVNAGMLPGRCDGNTTPEPTTCPSNSTWRYGNAGSALMNPGLGCITCHTTMEPREKFSFAGTVFNDLHSKDLCNGGSKSGGQVQIIGADGRTITLSVNSAGNFSTFSTLTMPYTAQVVWNGKVRKMTTPQDLADCNVCHTEQGATNAPGRIIWPE